MSRDDTEYTMEERHSLMAGRVRNRRRRWEYPDRKQHIWKHYVVGMGGPHRSEEFGDYMYCHLILGRGEARILRHIIQIANGLGELYVDDKGAALGVSKYRVWEANTLQEAFDMADAEAIEDFTHCLRKKQVSAKEGLHKNPEALLESPDKDLIESARRFLIHKSEIRRQVIENHLLYFEAMYIDGAPHDHEHSLPGMHLALLTLLGAAEKGGWASCDPLPHTKLSKSIAHYFQACDQ
jgi:hypothetical protein